MGILISTVTVVTLSVVVGSMAADGFAGWVAGAFVLMIRVLYSRLMRLGYERGTSRD